MKTQGDGLLFPSEQFCNSLAVAGGFLYVIPNNNIRG